jgi:CheY-like chemotaxis protein
MSRVLLGSFPRISFRYERGTGNIHRHVGIVVLSVEDDDAAFYIIRAAFSELPLSVQLLRAKNGQEALTLLHNQEAESSASQRPDLVLLDLNLPGLSGLDVLAAMKADRILMSIPVVMFSSSSRDQDRKSSFALGARQYITKPSTFDEVVEALKVACSVVPMQ